MKAIEFPLFYEPLHSDLGFKRVRDNTLKHYKLARIRSSKRDWERIGILLLSLLDKAVVGLFISVRTITYPVIYLFLGVEKVVRWWMARVSPVPPRVVRRLLQVNDSASGLKQDA